MGSISHLELIERVAKGDKGAFETLYRQVYPKIYRYLHRVLGDGEVARELGNEVMMEVWKGASGFRGDSKVFTWIWGITRKKVWKVMKKEEGEFRELEDWFQAGYFCRNYGCSHRRTRKEAVAIVRKSGKHVLSRSPQIRLHLPHGPPLRVQRPHPKNKRKSTRVSGALLGPR